MTLPDPLPGDGSYAPSGPERSDETAAAPGAVPGGLTPNRSKQDRLDVAETDSTEQLIDPQGEVDE